MNFLQLFLFAYSILGFNICHCQLANCIFNFLFVKAFLYFIAGFECNVTNGPPKIAVADNVDVIELRIIYLILFFRYSRFTENKLVLKANTNIIYKKQKRSTRIRSSCFRAETLIGKFLLSERSSRSCSKSTVPGWLCERVWRKAVCEI